MTMRLLLGSVAFALLSPVVVSGEANASESLTKKGYSFLDERSEPIWVSAEEAVVGVALRREMFAPDEREALEDYSRDVEQALDGLRTFNEHELNGPTGQLIDRAACSAILSAYAHTAFETGKEGLVDAIASAHAAVSWRVVDITPGFFLAAPSLLLSVETDDSSRGLTEQSQLLYVVYPEASFLAGGAPYCGAVLREPRSPTIGQQIVVLARTGPQDREGLIFAPTDAEIVLADDDGALLLPPISRPMMNWSA